MLDVWVCNSSPLIALARIQRLDLIESLAAEVVVPQTVVLEIEAGASRDGAAQAVRVSSRLRIRPDTEIPEAVRAWQLDPGESQVLAMALQSPGCGAVIDDRTEVAPSRQDARAGRVVRPPSGAGDSAPRKGLPAQWGGQRVWAAEPNLARASHRASRQ